MSVEGLAMAYLGSLVLAFTLGWWIAENKYRKALKRARAEEWDRGFNAGRGERTVQVTVQTDPRVVEAAVIAAMKNKNRLT